MKKKLFLGMAAAIMALAVGVTVKTVARQGGSFFGENLEALAFAEAPTGYCDEVSGFCDAFCPNCTVLYWAKGHKGPSRNFHGSCLNCGADF